QDGQRQPRRAGAQDPRRRAAERLTQARCGKACSCSWAQSTSSPASHRSSRRSPRQAPTTSSRMRAKLGWLARQRTRRARPWSRVQRTPLLSEYRATRAVTRSSEERVGAVGRSAGIMRVIRVPAGAPCSCSAGNQLRARQLERVLPMCPATMDDPRIAALKTIPMLPRTRTTAPMAQTYDRPPRLTSHPVEHVHAPGVVIVYGANEPRFEVRHVDGELMLGRGELIFDGVEDPCVSRRHARVSFDGGRWVIEDLGSRNGTWVDGRQVDGRLAVVTPRVLRLGG